MNVVNKIILIIFLGMLTNLAQAAVYKWVDKDGNVVYSQRPPPSGQQYDKPKVGSKNSRYPNEAESAPDATDNGSPAATSPGAGDGKDASKIIADSLAKSAETRRKNCDAAKTNLEIYTTYKRVKDKDGNVIRLDDNVRSAKIEEMKKNIQEFCD